ncbi:MAG: hypothetical protein HY922_12525 [Elusimicrobia bacterium]|nr:hypothetical protein [Elusimicrobiota bacterium]
MKPIARQAAAASVECFPLPSEPHSGGNLAALSAVAVLTTAMASALAFKDAWLGSRSVPAAAAPAPRAQRAAQAPAAVMDAPALPAFEPSPAGMGTAAPSAQPLIPLSRFMRSLGKMVEVPAERAALRSAAMLSDIVKQGAKREDGFQEMGTAPPSSVQLSYAVPPQKRDPIVLDLRGDGIRASTRKVRYDLFGDGRYARFNDVGSGVGVLVFDPGRNGVSGENGRELFGDSTDMDGDGRPDGFKDGFEALWGLARLAASRGRIPQAALKSGFLGPAELLALERAYGLRVRVGSFNAKAVSLKEAGVAGLKLSGSETLCDEDFDGQGNVLARREGAGFLRPDGSTGDYGAVWLQAVLQQFRKYAWL